MPLPGMGQNCHQCGKWFYWSGLHVVVIRCTHCTGWTKAQICGFCKSRIQGVICQYCKKGTLYIT